MKKEYFQMPGGCMKNDKAARSLFIFCWLAYAGAYLGRLNYAACLVEIIHTEGWAKGQAGLIATSFFITYGFGQIINGFIGDRISPKYMVGCGLGFSGIVNLIFPSAHPIPMAVFLWSINGFVQSMLWSPLLRLLSEWMPKEKRLRACVNMNSTVPFGTLAVYGMSAGLVFLGNWRWVFYVSGIVMVLITICWFLGIGSLERELEDEEEQEKKEESQGQTRTIPMIRLIFLSAMPLCAAALFMQGILKDGVTTWIPAFLEENFGLTSAAAILSTTVVPIINLSGVYLADFINCKLCRNEVLTTMLFFIFCFVSLLMLIFLSENSALFSTLLLAAATTSMMGANTLLACMIPSYYVRFGVCSTATGLLNSFAYVGCAVSTYGNGVIADRFGWNAILYCWCFCAVIGMITCALASKRWKSFQMLAKENKSEDRS